MWKDMNIDLYLESELVQPLEEAGILTLRELMPYMGDNLGLQDRVGFSISEAQEVLDVLRVVEILSVVLEPTQETSIRDVGLILGTLGLDLPLDTLFRVLKAVGEDRGGDMWVAKPWLSHQNRVDLGSFVVILHGDVLRIHLKGGGQLWAWGRHGGDIVEHAQITVGAAE